MENKVALFYIGKADNFGKIRKMKQLTNLPTKDIHVNRLWRSNT
jgi:hypothetical protein